MLGARTNAQPIAGVHLTILASTDESDSDDASGNYTWKDFHQDHYGKDSRYNVHHGEYWYGPTGGNGQQAAAGTGNNGNQGGQFINPGGSGSTSGGSGSTSGQGGSGNN